LAKNLDVNSRDFVVTVAKRIENGMNSKSPMGSTPASRQSTLKKSEDRRPNPSRDLVLSPHTTNSKRSLPVKPKHHETDEWGAIVRQQAEVMEKMEKDKMDEKKRMKNLYRNELQDNMREQQMLHAQQKQKEREADLKLLHEQEEREKRQKSRDVRAREERVRKTNELAARCLRERNEIMASEKLKREAEERSFIETVRKQNEEYQQQTKIQKEKRQKAGTDMRKLLDNQVEDKRRRTDESKKTEAMIAEIYRSEDFKPFQNNQERYKKKLNDGVSRRDYLNNFAAEKLEAKKKEGELNDIAFSKMVQERDEKLLQDERRKDAERKHREQEANTTIAKQIEEKRLKAQREKEESLRLAEEIGKKVSEEEKREEKQRKAKSDQMQSYRKGLIQQAEDSKHYKHSLDHMSDFEKRVNQRDLKNYENGEKSLTAKLPGFSPNDQERKQKKMVESKLINHNSQTRISNRSSRNTHSRTMSEDPRVDSTNNPTKLDNTNTNVVNSPGLSSAHSNKSAIISSRSSRHINRHDTPDRARGGQLVTNDHVRSPQVVTSNRISSSTERGLERNRHFVPQKKGFEVRAKEDHVRGLLGQQDGGVDAFTAYTPGKKVGVISKISSREVLSNKPQGNYAAGGGHDNGARRNSGDSFRRSQSKPFDGGSRSPFDRKEDPRIDFPNPLNMENGIPTNSIYTREKKNKFNVDSERRVSRSIDVGTRGSRTNQSLNFGSNREVYTNLNGQRMSVGQGGNSLDLDPQKKYSQYYGNQFSRNNSGAVQRSANNIFG